LKRGSPKLALLCAARRERKARARRVFRSSRRGAAYAAALEVVASIRSQPDLATEEARDDRPGNVLGPMEQGRHAHGGRTLEANTADRLGAATLSPPSGDSRCGAANARTSIVRGLLRDGAKTHRFRERAEASVAVEVGASRARRADSFRRPLLERGPARSETAPENSAALVAEEARSPLAAWHRAAIADDGRFVRAVDAL